eukprot:14499800-Ditylum_brightwellii.AAC.1
MSTNEGHTNGDNLPGFTDQWVWSDNEVENCKGKPFEEKLMNVDESEWKTVGKRQSKAEEKTKAKCGKHERKL